MSTDPKKPVIPQATPFQRFTIRLVDGRFVRVPKSDFPVTHGVDQSATSNQTEIRDLYQLVNGQFVRIGKAGASPAEPITAKSPPVPVAPASAEYPDPTFDMPDEHRLPETR